MQATSTPVQSRAKRESAQFHRANLQRLTASVLAREGFDSRAIEVAKSIDLLLRSHSKAQHPVASWVLPSFESRRKPADTLSLRDVSDMALDLYETSVAELPPQFRDVVRGVVGKSPAYDGRAFRQSASQMEEAANMLMMEPKPKVRDVGQAIWFAARVIGSVAPPPDLNRVRECWFCHRHAYAQSVCERHRVEGRYTAPPKQKARYQEALAQVTEEVEVYLQAHPKEVERMAKLDNDFAAVQALVQLATRVFGATSIELLKKAMAQASSQDQDVSIQRLASAWHALPEVDDKVGAQQLELSVASDAAELVSHMTRLEAFERIGRDQTVNRRRSIEDASSIEQILKMRTGGHARTAVAKMFRVTAGQVAKLEQSHGWTAVSEATPAPAPSQPKRRGRPPKSPVVATAPATDGKKSTGLRSAKKTLPSRQPRSTAAKAAVAKAAVAKAAPPAPAKRSAVGPTASQKHPARRARAAKPSKAAKAITTTPRKRSRA